MLNNIIKYYVKGRRLYNNMAVLPDRLINFKIRHTYNAAYQSLKKKYTTLLYKTNFFKVY